MSPAMRPWPRIEPGQVVGRAAARGGMTSASGFPNRVTRKGRPVRRTRSSAARQVALNFETAISSTSRFYMVNDHGRAGVENGRGLK